MLIRTRVLASGMACAALAGVADAASISWGPATDVSASTDVATNDSTIQALSFSDAGGADATVNGVLFTAVDAVVGTTTAGEVFTFGSGEGALQVTEVGNGNVRGLGAFDPTGDANYDNILGGMFDNNVAAGPTYTFEIQNLVDGRDYTIQLWSHDGRNFDIPERTTTFDDGNGSSVTLTQGIVPGTDNGDFVIGTFTASGTTQTINVSSNVSAVINAYQLRAVPEPGSLALLSLCGLLVARRRRDS